MSVEVKKGVTLQTGIPNVLFERANYSTIHQCCVTNGGRRFLFVEPEEGKVEPIHVVFNWAEQLKRPVPTGN